MRQATPFGEVYLIFFFVGAILQQPLPFLQQLRLTVWEKRSALQFQQRIALLYGAAGFGRDSGIVIRIADNERRGHGIAFGLNGLQFKADQRLAFLHLVTLVDKVGKVLAPA